MSLRLIFSDPLARVLAILSDPFKRVLATWSDPFKRVLATWSDPFARVLATWSDPFKRVLALLAVGLVLVACENRNPPSPTPPVSGRPIRVIASRETPRSPFSLEVEAEMVAPGRCEILLQIRSNHGGAASVEFVLPESALPLAGDIRRECILEPGVLRAEQLTVQVPEEGYHLLAVAVVQDGLQVESYVEIGDPPAAEDRGLRTRVNPRGDGVLRLGPEELGEVK